MTDWIYHTPEYEGHGPKGFSCVTHRMEYRPKGGTIWERLTIGTCSPRFQYRYRLKEGLEQAVRQLWASQGHEIPPLEKQIDYEKYRDALNAYYKEQDIDVRASKPSDFSDKTNIDSCLAFMRALEGG